MKITVLSSLLREPFMIDVGFALDASVMVQQLIEPDLRKFIPREEFSLRYLTPGMSQDEPEGSATPPQNQETGVIAIVPLHGAMLKYGTLCSYGTTEIATYLARAMADERVTGILLDVDTPGGSVNSIAPLIEVLKARTKPVLAYCDTCCSAGYFASLYCDEIMASNDISALFGSIGVQVAFADIQPYWEKQGVRFHRITPPESADKNQAFELAREGKYDQIVLEMLSPMAQRFQKEVRQWRPGLKEEPGVLTGKTFDAHRSLELGLISSIGNHQAAIARINELALGYEAKDFITANQ
jgi:protease IV